MVTSINVIIFMFFIDKMIIILSNSLRNIKLFDQCGAKRKIKWKGEIGRKMWHKNL